MRKTLILISGLFLLAVFACNSYTPSNSGKIREISFSIIDTLKIHRNADRFLDYSNRRVYTGNIDGKEIGFESIRDSVTYFYERFNGLWLKQDSFRFGIEFINTNDLNGDNFKDIIAIYNITGAGGNAENYSLLYLPQERRFKHNKSFDLPNVFFDSNKHVIRSAWWGGPTSSQTKELYEFQGDSLKLKEGITYFPAISADNGKEHLEIYTISKNKRKTIKIHFGSSETLWKKFSGTLWEGIEY